ncbi:MAG: class I SAM-dependent methyltransferase [Candidatus Dormibacteraeota bacterium]|nr:class I SAM-dependent methyltransferase [Candidatus Dormibacteraeota bacterium]
MDRLGRVRQYVDVAHRRGLEIGPLVSPIVTPDMGEVYYADHASAEELHQKYLHDPGVDVDLIAPVDFVWGDKTLAECAASAAPFDYVVASHVVEHVPDLVGWLREVAQVLTPGGRLCLVVPDRRLTFDVRRRPTNLAEIVEAYVLKFRRPPTRAIFDHFSRHVDVDTGALWQGTTAYPEDVPVDLSMGWAQVQRAQTGEYLDTHCWVFSDGEFVELLGELMRMGLLDFKFAGFAPPLIGEYDFFACLERLDDTLSPEDRLSNALASLPAPAEMATVPLSAAQTDPVGVMATVMSEKEVALILRKREVMARARSLLQRGRRRS